MFGLVSFDQRHQYVQAIAFRGIRCGVHECFDFLESGLIVGLGLEGSDVHG
jgi:hypothetical protein